MSLNSSFLPCLLQKKTSINHQNDVFLKVSGVFKPLSEVSIFISVSGCFSVDDGQKRVKKSRHRQMKILQCEGGLKYPYNTGLQQMLSVFRMLQEKLEEPISEPPSPRQFQDGEDAVGDLASHITSLREEIRRLRQQLAKSEADCKYNTYLVK